MRSMDVTWYHTRSVVLQRCQWRMSWYRNAMTWRCDRSKVWSLPTEWSLTANASSLLYYYTQYKYVHVGTLSHIHILNLRHTDIQTYRPKVCIWKQHNSHALVSTLSTSRGCWLVHILYVVGWKPSDITSGCHISVTTIFFCTFYSSFHPKNCDISLHIYLP